MKANRIFAVLLVMMLPFSGCLGEEGGKSVDECDPSSEICGKVNILDATVENTSSDDKVTSVLVSAKAASNSHSFTIDKISYHPTCERDGDTVIGDQIYLTDTTELDSDDQFQFIAELSNCSASQDESVTFIVQVVNGSSTYEVFEVDSTQSGSSLM